MGKRFLVLEQASDVGGTALEQIPGVLRLESETYGYSFSRTFGGMELERTLSRRAKRQSATCSMSHKFDLRQHMRFRQRLASAIWKPDLLGWELTTDTGDVLTHAVPADGDRSAVIADTTRYEGVGKLSHCPFTPIMRRAKG